MSNAVSGGKVFHVPGISDQKKDTTGGSRIASPVSKVWNIPFVVYLTCILSINIGAVIIFAFLYQKIFAHGKSLDAVSGPSGSGYIIASSAHSDPFTLSLLVWVGTFSLDFIVFLIFVVKSRAYVRYHVKKVMGIIISATLITMMMAAALILVSPYEKSVNAQSFSEWVKEKYSLSSISSFSPSDNSVEGKDANGNTVNINLINVGNTYYSYQTKEELLSIAKEINQDVK